MKRDIFLILIAAIFLSGCGANSHINSSPSGAKVYINDQLVGKTPYIFKGGRGFFGDSAKIKIVKEGYKPIEQLIEQDFDGAHAAIGCGIAFFFIVPLIFHLPWSFQYEDNYFYELEPLTTH